MGGHGPAVELPSTSATPTRVAAAMADADAIVHTAYVKDRPERRRRHRRRHRRTSPAPPAGRRLVHLSTDVVFDGRLGRPYREDDLLSPNTDYGRAKAAAEAAIADAPDAVIVRTSLIYGGPGRPPSPSERSAGDPGATFYVDELRCPIQVDDLAAAVLELLELDHVGPLHVAGPDGISRAELATLIAGHEVRTAPAPPGRPLDCRLDTTTARALLTTGTARSRPSCSRPADRRARARASPRRRPGTPPAHRGA